MTPDDSVFNKPTEPKNSWQVLSWLIFEPLLLERYSRILTKKEGLKIFYKTFAWLTLLILIFYVLGCFVNASFDLPNIFPSHYEKTWLKEYQTFNNVYQKSIFLIKLNFTHLISTVGVIFILFNFLYAIFPSLTNGLSSSVAGILGAFPILLLGHNIYGEVFSGRIGSFTGNILISFFWGISLSMGGAANIIRMGFVHVIRVGVSLGIIYLVVFSMYFGFDYGITGAIAVITGYYVSHFRVFFFPFYFIKSLFGVTLSRSPYHNDAVIWFPIFGIEKQFCQLALADPMRAQKFIRFLREYRPLQIQLADSITHAGCAGNWLSNPLAFEVLTAPFIESENQKPSPDWLTQLVLLKEQLISYRHQTQLSLKRQNFQQFLTQLETFTSQTLIENQRWRDEYLQALALWKTVALEEWQKLEAQAQQQEPITANVYLAGEALRPDINSQVFLGRDDLKDELALRIYSSQQMPLFLFQGQRRVGKTSLLNFLEPLLGSGFKVVYQDLQSAASGTSVQTWLADLQTKIANKLNSSVDNAIANNGDWLAAWQQFEAWLRAITPGNGYKLILAFDEYEQLHNILQTDPEQGARLLAAMRSFSQHQNHIVFLFVGAALFTELSNPNWGQYFVQAQTFKVDYLHKADALRLITEPVSLIYPPELPEQLFALTQGHPALLQWLCSELVNIANRTSKKAMTQEDLETVIKKAINDSSLAPMDRFWKEFCQDAACKATVRDIINQQLPSDKKQLHRLREHGFIFLMDNGLWRLRVPLFERWLTAFDRIDLD